MSAEYVSAIPCTLRIVIRASLNATAPLFDQTINKKPFHDCSDIRPPTSITTGKLSSLAISLEVIGDIYDRNSLSKDHNVPSVFNEIDDLFEHMEDHHGENLIFHRDDPPAAAAMSHHYQLLDCRYHLPKFIQQQDDTNRNQSLFALLSAGLRRSIYSFSVYTPGIRCIDEQGQRKLMNFAPLTFRPGFGFEMIERSKLIDPISQTLARFLLESQDSNTQWRCSVSDSAPTCENLSHYLWITLVHKLNSRKSSFRQMPRESSRSRDTEIAALEQDSIFTRRDGDNTQPPSLNSASFSNLFAATCDPESQEHQPSLSNPGCIDSRDTLMDAITPEISEFDEELGYSPGNRQYNTIFEDADGRYFPLDEFLGDEYMESPHFDGEIYELLEISVQTNNLSQPTFVSSLAGLGCEANAGETEFSDLTECGGCSVETLSHSYQIRLLEHDDKEVDMLAAHDKARDVEQFPYD